MSRIEKEIRCMLVDIEKLKNSMSVLYWDLSQGRTSTAIMLTMSVARTYRYGPVRAQREKNAPDNTAKRGQALRAHVGDTI